jgi:NAD(P)-dependent dehydrogenase (short-subunit alcohol dehydrogenase family)
VLQHAYLAIQIGGPRIARGGGGTITFVGSLAGSMAIRNQVAYGAAKAALHHLVRSYSLECARDGVRINAVAPGFIRTPRLNRMLNEEQWQTIGKFVPLGRAALPSEIAAVLLFLSCDLSSHVTGQVLSVDGGVGAVAALPELQFGPADGKTNR